jgi:hypothetical protein
MQLILFASLPLIIAFGSVFVVRSRREHRRAEAAKARRYEKWKAQREQIPKVSSNLRGSTAADANDRSGPRVAA